MYTSRNGTLPVKYSDIITMRATQKKMMSKPVIRTDVGRKSGVPAFLRASPVWRMAIAPTKTRYRARPRPGELAFASQPLRFLQAVRDKDVVVLVIPGRNPVSPPQLARNTPVLDVFEPLVVYVTPVFRNETRPHRSLPLSARLWPGHPSPHTIDR